MTPAPPPDTPYRIRAATLADRDVLIRHRIAMFTDMGNEFDASALASAFSRWLTDTMTAGTYLAWLAEAPDGTIAAGAGATIIPWPPGPRYAGERLAFVYNVYTEAAHRRRGLARQLMETIHTWCAGHGVTSVALNASRDGQALYEAIGYEVTPSPMMFFAVRPAAGAPPAPSGS
jgi:GNAT superfamily N-acetyltransferase